MGVVLRHNRFIIRFYDDTITPEDISKALKEAKERFSGEAGRLGEYEFLVLCVHNHHLEWEGVVALIPLL